MMNASILVVTLLVCGVLNSFASPSSGGPIPALPTPPEDQVHKATANSWRYMYTHDRSPHTNGAHECGPTFLLALACWTGDTTGDYRVLKQIRYNLTGKACLVAAGGYGSQHERIFTGSCVLIRQTPRLWGQLTDDEKLRMDLLMKAALVASAYTTSDAGAADKVQNTDLMGGRNLNRGWNPNYREGMIGMMIVGTIWHGGAQGAYAFLNTYDHAAFAEQLRAAGLTNTYRTFNWASDHRGSGAPNAQRIQRDIRNYTYQGRGLDKAMEIYWLLTTRTYGAKVSTGLNNGAGLDGAGKLASGQDQLPNIGKPGMLYELASGDAGGPRSSITYAYTGFRPNLINQIVMLASGYWQRGPMADECVALIKVGVPDLYYKLEHGYIGYSKGHASRRPVTVESDGWDFLAMRSLWYDVAEKFHSGLTTCAHAGDDVSIAATGGDTGASVHLSAAASTAAAGTTIASSRWLSADGELLAAGADITVSLPVGAHTITLEVKDSAGRISRDTTTVRVFPAAK